jgi:RNA polymerase sigma factor (sigma-70 family)
MRCDTPAVRALLTKSERKMNSVTDIFTTGEYAADVNANASADLKHLFQNYRHLLVCFVMRYTRSHEDAEDVVQAAFVQALSTESGGAPEHTLPKSLFGTALMLARDRMRNHALEHGARPGEHLAAQQRRLQQDPFELIALHQFKARVEASLRAFPQAVLETFDLVVNGETSHTDAAEYLGIPLATVQTHMAHVGDMVRCLGE